VTHDSAVAQDVRLQVRGRLEDWKRRRDRLESGQLGFERDTDITGLLRKPTEPPWGRWSAPLSMREVEPEIALQLRRDDPSTSEDHPWSWNPPIQPQGASA
jgi:hypothetical protein